MADNFKDGVSRVLEVANRQLSNVIWQAGKPPLDSELNLVGQIGWEALSEALRSQTPSGFLINPTSVEEDFVFYEQSTNYFEIKRDVSSPLTAIVNGWVVPVLGTESSDGIANAIKLPAPPTTDSETNIVFLEVWRAVLDPNDATNRPDESSIYKYGNVLYSAGSPELDEMTDPTLGFETTKRVQVQYRLRVQGLSKADLVTYPSGLGDPDVLAQGTTSAPVVGYRFFNQKDNGDSGLWRAGDGSTDSKSDLGTVDGYVYAIPVCAVFRRNSNSYQAIVTGGSPNHNGSVLRRPTASSSILSETTLTADLSHDTATPTASIAFTVSGGLESALDDEGFMGDVQGGSTKRFLVLGEGLNKEVISITEIDRVNRQFTIADRGRAGTQAKNHMAGTKIEVYNTRPDGLFADQIVSDDVLDLRHSINLGEWDYNRLLESSVKDLLFGGLRTTFKQAGSGSNSIGKKVEEVSVLVNLSGEARNYANIVDAPDGIRTTWSDAPVVQKDVSFLIDPTTTLNTAGLTTVDMDSTLQSTWTIGAKFNPRGFMYEAPANQPIQNGSFITFKIGGDNVTDGARAGLKPDLTRRVVRFISPSEVSGKYHPFKVYFTNYNRPNGFGEVGTQGEYVYPTESSNFEEPFIVLGETLKQYPSLVADITKNGVGVLRNLKSKYLSNLGETSKYWAIKTSENLDDELSVLRLYGTTTLSDLITDNQTDFSGTHSKAYAVLFGDKDEQITNNGVFKVVGMGSNATIISDLIFSVDDTDWNISNDYIGSESNWIYLKRIGNSDSDFITEPTHNLILDIRTQNLDSRDDECMIAFTNTDDTVYPNLPPVGERTSPLLISTTIQYPPARGGTVRVLDNVHTIGLRNITSNYLRNAPTTLDSNASSEIPMANGEVYLPVNNHIESWSKLDLSDEEEISNSQIKKEAEVFADIGSKTFVIRPYQNQGIRLMGHLLSSSAIGQPTYRDGVTKKFEDALDIFSDSKTQVYAIPQELMPTFGRQDIPYHVKTGDNDPYMEGYNHLFLDQRSLDNNNISNCFKFLGGFKLGTGVYPVVFATGDANGPFTNYGSYSGNNASLANQGCFISKKISLSGKPTSEFGDVLNGIKLPPFFGIARLYGVYEAGDFNSNAPNATIGSHESDRETPLGNNGGTPPTNLLRKDNDLFPIYILKEGGAEITIDAEKDAHTYVVTEHAIDITKIPTYDSTKTFSDFEYVVECTVFGFGLGFISSNNFVLARKFNPAEVAVGAVAGTALENIRMCLPSAVPHNDEIYIAGTRTVYQGDPFQTIGGASPSYTDQAYRYGLIESANSFKFNTPRGQEKVDGSSAIEVPNKRTLQVLASMDFYTTMGTGAIGGYVRPNSLNDVGFANYTSENAIIASGKRIPTTSDQDLPQTKVGLFTESLNDDSQSARASLTLFNAKNAYFVGNFSDYKIKIQVVDPIKNSTYTYEFGGDPATTTFRNLIDDIKITFNGLGIKLTEEDRLNSSTLTFESPTRGNKGNQTTLSVSLVSTTGGSDFYHTGASDFTRLYTGLRVGSDTDSPTPTKVRMSGGKTKPVNAFLSDGEQNSKQIDSSLVGLTSRLPLGILVGDHDFMCEDILRDGTSRLNTFGSKQTSLPSRAGSDAQGRPYTKITGSAGELLHMGDGDVLSYGAFPLEAGTNKYRIFRGGGSVYGASGEVKGAPLTFLNESFVAEDNPILKGSVLACRAMLVRNFKEEAFNTTNRSVRSHGGEIQLLVATQAVFQGNTADFSELPLYLGGELSPSGYGEGFACVDRFRIKGLPLVSLNEPILEDVEPALLSITKNPFNNIS